MADQDKKNSMAEAEFRKEHPIEDCEEKALDVQIDLLITMYNQ
jgi:hypothetical protein